MASSEVNLPSRTINNIEENCDDNEEQVDNSDMINDYYEDDFDEIPAERMIRSECDLGQNKTFSKYRINEIEHTNALLMKKVLAHSNRPRKVVQPAPIRVKTSAEINRRKQQRKIEHDNLILLKKIQSIKPFGLSKNKSYS